MPATETATKTHPRRLYGIWVTAATVAPTTLRTAKTFIFVFAADTLNFIVTKIEAKPETKVLRKAKHFAFTTRPGE